MKEKLIIVSPDCQVKVWMRRLQKEISKKLQFKTPHPAPTHSWEQVLLQGMPPRLLTLVQQTEAHAQGPS